MKSATIKIYDEHENEVVSEEVAYSLDSELFGLQSQFLEEVGEGHTSIIVYPEKVESSKDVMILPMELRGYNEMSNDLTKINFVSVVKLSNEQISTIRDLKKTTGVIIYKNTDAANEDDLKLMDSVDKDLFDKGKSPSQRLRSVFFLLWRENPEGYDQFKDYYAFKMDNLIEHYKKKLPS